MKPYNTENGMQVNRCVDVFCSYAVVVFTNLPLLNNKVRVDELLVSKTDFNAVKLREIGGG